MSARIKGLFSSKKKKDGRNGPSSSSSTSSRPHSKEIFSNSSNLSSCSSLATSQKPRTSRPDSVASSLASLSSAQDTFHQREASSQQQQLQQTLTPSATTVALDPISKLQQQQPLSTQQTTSTVSTTISQGSSTSPNTTTVTAGEQGIANIMTSESNIEDLDITVQPIKTTNLGTLPSPPLTHALLEQPPPRKEQPDVDLDRKQEGQQTQGQDQPQQYQQEVLRSEVIDIIDTELERGSLSVDNKQAQQRASVSNSNANRSFGQGNVSLSTRDPFGNSSLRYDQDESRISQHRDGSFVEHQRSFVEEDMKEDGMYLNSTREFFPVEDQDEQVYLDQYSDEGDEFPVLVHKVSKLQKQVREMRKFMRGLVQLQVEQYEPATIMIQAWWRGCLVRRELKKQKVFSWHRNPSRIVQKVKYMTKADLQQSCERISAPKPSILVTADLGAEKETIAAIKLQAIFRSQLVQKRVRAHYEGNRAATIIQARWRGYRTRNLDTRLGVEQLRFRNLKVQKAFGRVSIKLQYLQGRILSLEENSVPLHEAQELINKEIEDMADQIDGLKQDVEQGLKQLDEQMCEEREQTTIEMKALTDRIQKLEEEMSLIRNSNNKMEKRVKTLSLEVPARVLETDASGQDDDDDDDDEYEVQYDEDGNRIEKAPTGRHRRRESLLDQQRRQAAEAVSRRSSQPQPITDAAISGSPTQLVESPIPMPQQQHRGSVSSVHSQGTSRRRSVSSQSASPSQAFPRAFPASFSPTLSNAQPLQENGGAFAAGVRPHSIAYPSTSNGSTSNGNPPRPLTMDPDQLFRFHQNANQYIPVSPSSASAGVTSYPGLPAVQQQPVDPKKYVSTDDFEYMQAEVDTLRINNDRLEGMVRELTMRLNAMAANFGS
ncbi:hypothetical protein BGZ83_006256 [Gryganskiella cystojenkinii]|nr:hypothetical protein BGZ83_006256 [Gryganskiella cystojenkinii]